MSLLASASSNISSVAVRVYSSLGRSTAVIGSVSFAIYLIYEKILIPPPALRHIPHLNFFTLFKVLIMRRPIEEVTREVFNSDVVQSSGNGIYLRRDNNLWSVRLTRPQDVQFLLSQRELFPKSTGSRVSRRGTLSGRAFVGPNIIFAVGDEWKRYRKIVNPAFRRAMPMKAFETITQKAIDTIVPNKPIDVHTLCGGWSLDIMGKTIYGHDLGTLDDGESEWVAKFERISAVVQKTFYFAFPFLERKFKYLIPELKNAHREMTEYGDMINALVQKKREYINEKGASNMDDQEKDLITLMIEASMKEEFLSNEEFQANVFLFFLAGHESSSCLGSFVLYHLAAHPEIQQRAREEAIHVFGDGYDIHPTFQETEKLPYITMIIKETLRRNTNITHLVDRVATRDTEISGTFIPKGTHVGVTLDELHHNPKVWKDPDTFDPERFAPGGEADQLEGLPWTPFGNGGARVCIGMKSSMAQQRVLLSMLLRKYVWRLPENSVHKNCLVTEGYMVVRPINLELVFEKRY